ncbi:hypothetical protein KR215_010635, partial [Drosophila sulfurigaster]
VHCDFRRSMPPVSFKVFSQLVENLPDIAFQIQVTGSAKPKGTLDECAEWFYNEFYKNSAIREKYEIKVRSCPLAIKNKLLQLPIAEEATTTATGTATEIGVDVAIKNYFIIFSSGRFQFPVSFATFKQYINKQRLINDLLRKKTDQERQLALGDSKKLEDLLRKGYNIFYMFPHRRRLSKYEFKEASPEILELLLKPGVPLDEAAVKTVSESPSCKSLTSIVSFDVFEKFIKNIYEIVWQLKLNDLKNEGFDNCAKAYYIAFYLTPEIRERIQYELVPCTSSMRNRLLALPSEADRAILLEMQKISLEIATSQELELNLPYNKDAVESNAMSKDDNPVTFKLFKRYIKNLDGIVSEMLSSDEYKGKTKDECALEYFKAFYTTSQIRTKFKPELKACPSKIRAKLLALPAEEEVIVDVVDIDNNVPNEGNPPKVLTVAQDKDNVVDLPSKENLVKIKGINYTYPVDIKTFLRYVNYDELKKQLVDAHAKTKKIGDEANEKQLFKRFYYSFYLDKSLRKQFNYNFNAAPAHQRSKFTEMAVAITEKHGEQLPQQVANTEPFYTTSQIRKKFKPELKACPSGRFQFPVSFETFKRCINYDELLHPLLLHVTQQCNEKARMIAKSDPMRCRNVFTRYYRSFYVRPIVRKQYAYRFESVSASLKSKLMQYAVPLNARARKEMNIAATIGAPKAYNMALSGIEKKMPHHEYEGSPSTTLPVSFKLFKKYITNLDAIVQQMLKCDDHADKTEDECAFQYFTAFYLEPAVREKYEFQIKPCPAKLREKILSIPSVTETVPSSTGATSKIVAGNESSSKSVTETLPSSTAATNKVVATNVSSLKGVPKTIPSSIATTSEVVTGKLLRSKSVPEAIPRSTAAISEVADTNESSSKGVTETHASSTAATSKIVAGNDSSSKSVTETIPSSRAATKEVVAASESSSKSVTETIPSSTAATSEVDAGNESSSLPSSTAATNKVVATNESSSKSVTETLASSTAGTNELVSGNKSSSKSVTETIPSSTAATSEEHNLKYLIYTSHGLKQTVWCILSQLTCSEFKKYTCIHNGESFYKDESLFSRVYSHVIHEGNWPINLFVKLSMLIELLRSKDVQIDELDLAHLSPKVLHSSELMRYTNFDDIAERNYRNRTGDRVNNLVDLFSEVENFYVECWMQDQWIQQVPRVTSQELKLANAKIEPSDCPATQLEQSIAGNSLFVDVEDVVPATQLPEAQSDPLMETSIEMPTVQIKQEPVKLLSNMRFTIDSSQSQEVVCENISPEEQIINLDEDDEGIAAELSCFAIVPPKDRSPPLSFLNANLSKCEFDDLMKDVSLSPELQLQITNQLMSLESSQIEVATSPTEESQVPVADVPPAATATAVAAPASPVRSVTIRKPSRAFKSTLPSKRPRLMADNVPQLRHDFRPLPFTAAVPNQAAVNPSAQQELPTTSSSQVQSQSQQDSSDPPMTASQELATDNTLMASSQLQHLLDAPHVNVRQVNELPIAVDCVSDKNDRASLSMPQAVLHQQIVFSTLQRFLYFESLTTSQIAKYQINSLSVGSLHQQALISVNGQLFNVNGQLLEHLFPQLARSLLQDLQHLLNNVSEFNYNCRLNLHQDTKEDLRLRVLYAFMRASPPFTHIRLQFENATREWATFSATNERDRDLLRRKPKCDVRASLKPEILQRMKEVKSLCY